MAPRAGETEGVFLNCPFDPGYKPILDAIVFCVYATGFVPRCSLEFDDATELRMTKILRLIGECKYGIHDISAAQLDATSGLPRFNMPFELGVFLGCKAFGARAHRSKIGLVLDRDPYRYQRSLSDLSGMDIRYHSNDPREAIRAVREWLRVVSRRTRIPGPESIWQLYEKFQQALPRICAIQRIRPDELTYVDYSDIASRWLRRIHGRRRTGKLAQR